MPNAAVDPIAATAFGFAAILLLILMIGALDRRENPWARRGQPEDEQDHSRNGKPDDWMWPPMWDDSRDDR